MLKRTPVLWIEDSARYELSELAGPVQASRQYLLGLAEDATTALSHLTSSQFEVVIVDIRLPPGNHKVWSSLYQKAGNDKIRAGLGIHLLRWMLDPNSAERKAMSELPPPPAWIRPEQIAVFTADNLNAVRDLLKPVEVKVMQQKSTAGKDTVLLDLIKQVMQSN
jgi:CheY-like chemotaxis protein